MHKKLETIQQNIGYSFREMGLLREALTHTSYSNEHRRSKEKNNERLEFLGDSVLSFIISEYLFDQQNPLPEGVLTKVRASVVRESTLKNMAVKIGLGECLFLGKGEIAGGGQERASILADATEALIAAVYLDGGIDVARKFVLDNMMQPIEESLKGKAVQDYKTRLQEELQKNKKVQIRYQLEEESGPDHDKTFKMSVLVCDQPIGFGVGKSKKEAEQKAAQSALEKIIHEQIFK